MWIKEKLNEKKGWSHLWEDDGQYWFFFCTPEKTNVYDLEEDSYAIVWLTTSQIVTKEDGIRAALDAPYERGAVAYGTKRELNQAWERLLQDPTAFMIRASL